MWPGNIGVALVQNALDQGPTPAHDVADHPQVRIQSELVRFVALDQMDALAGELGAHWRIDVGVTSCDSMARSLGDHGNASHESAANAENVDMHELETERAGGRRWKRARF